MFQPRTLADLASDWPKDLDHISASSVKMIARCPEQWRQRYLEGRKAPPAAALIAGRADHAAIEHSMVQKIATFTDLPTGEVMDKFIDVFEQEVEHVGIAELEVKDRGDSVLDKAGKVRVLDKMKTEGVDMVGMYHNSMSPLIQPTSVEEEFVVELPSLPVKVIGRLDLVATSTRTDLAQPHIIDRKTTRRKSVLKPDPEWVIQAETYQLAKGIPHAWHISCVPAHRVIAAETTSSLLWMPPRTRGIAELQLEHLAAEVGFFYTKYGPDQPWPTRGKLHPWACGYCGFRDNCWGWK